MVGLLCGHGVSPCEQLAHPGASRLAVEIGDAPRELQRLVCGCGRKSARGLHRRAIPVGSGRQRKALSLQRRPIHARCIAQLALLGAARSAWDRSAAKTLYSAAVGSLVRLALAVLLLCCGMLVASRRAQALPSDCGAGLTQAPEEIWAKPGDGDEAVALDAPIVVRYAEHTDVDALQASASGAGADPCANQLVCLFRDASADGGARREPVRGGLMRVDDHTVAFIPTARLDPHTEYFVLVARPGFDTASRTELSFVTGTKIDREPPSFDGRPSAFRIEVDAAPRACDPQAGSARVRISVPRLSDDGDPQSVEILLSLTHAAGLTTPILKARARNPASDQGALQLAFLLDAKQAAEPVCVGLRAVDGVGKSAKAAEQCFDPVRGSFFAPCGVFAVVSGRQGSRARSGTLIGLVALGALCVRRRRRAETARRATRIA
jgi:hypothetical protein